MIRFDTADSLCPSCMLEDGLAESADQVIPGTVIEHFEVKGKIGQGGMGEVYLARDNRLDRLVALKFLPRELQSDSKARARFLREAKTAANLNHPFICKIYEIGDFFWETFISMEYVDGETLEAHIARGPLPVSKSVQIAIEIADALSEAHERGIVHRDIKPANIMLTSGGHVKVMDLGLAKAIMGGGSLGPQGTTVSALTASHTVVGSLPYLSPEQARGEEVDARSDLFSLGCVIYEMLSGGRPFDGTTAALLFDQILNQDPVPLSERNPALPSDLDAITSKALEKDRKLRYQGADELMSDLRELDLKDMDQKGIAPRQTAPKRFESLSKPRIAVAAAIVLSLVVTFVLWYVLSPRRSPQLETGVERVVEKSEDFTSTEEATEPASLPTQNPEAYDFFLRGRTYEQRAGWKPEDRENAQRMYEKAIFLDPEFALARARLAIVVGDTDEAKHALRLDPDLPEAHLAMGRIYMSYNDFESAGREFDLAEEGLPQNSYIRGVIAREPK